MKNLYLPNHVAIIPDGNRRWAKSRGLPTLVGHQKGFDALFKVGKYARKIGIKVMTIWAFSTENWGRSKEEVSYLMNLFKSKIDQYLKEAQKEKIRLIHLGRKDRIDRQLKEKIINAEEKTKDFTKYYLGIALDYGGRDEITRAINKIQMSESLPSRQAGKIQIKEEGLNQYLDTKYLPYPNPDLIIRTGGEKRLSGFLPLQSQYSELIFVKKYLPDFAPADFNQCLKEYSRRSRRFGK